MSFPTHARLAACAAALGLAVAALLLPYNFPTALASHTPDPSSVTIAGSLQSELGCAGDWQPECGATRLAYDANDGVWQGVFNAPAGGWEYKAPVNDNWGENYGRFAQQNGSNIPLALASAGGVKFYYDHKTHWVTSSRNAVIAVAPGSFQSELGCSGDWDPGCLRSWLQDPDEDGVYTFETTSIPPGGYECKVAVGESWDENYGQGGEQNGANIPFNVSAPGEKVTFSYVAATRVLSITTGAPPPPQGDVQWGGLRHDTFDPYYRSPFGAVEAGSAVTLRFRTAHFDVDGVSVRVYTYDAATGTTAGPVDHPMSFYENRVEGGAEYDVWALTLRTPPAASVLYYKFRVTDQGDEDFYSDSYTSDHDNLNQGGEGAASDGEPFPAFQLTAYAPGFRTPAWLRDANVYQIFPDRFRNGDPSNDYCRPGSTAGCPTFYGDQTPLLREPWNTAVGDPRPAGPFQNQYGTQFFGGDLKGVEQKLDYLQSLGIDAIYLNPIFKARSNHRYDADDFLEVDPALGGDAALASLAAEAERRGVRLILDGVFNHSSSDSRYFDRYHRYSADGGCESLASPFRGWFNFLNSNTPCAGADYESWFGFDSLAVFNESDAVRDFFYRGAADNVTRHWYERGAAGWRFDVATDFSHNWWHEYRPYAKGYKADGPLVGEIWEDASQFLAGDQLDSVMNYRFRKNVLGFARGANWSDNDNSGGNQIVGLTPSEFDRALRSVREDYPAQATAAMLNLLDSHDTNRSLYVLTLSGDGGLEQARQRLKLSALFQFTYPGAPMVYYGDEAALDAPALANGPNGPEDDPYNRAPFPWEDEAGDQNVYGPADAGVRDFYTRLAHMRKQFASLREGSFETLLTGDTTPSDSDDNTYAFARVSGAERAVVALNNGAAANTASVPVAAHFADGASLVDVLTGAHYAVAGGHVALALAPRAGVVLLPAPAVIDTAAPAASIAADPAAGAGGFHNATPVTVELSAADAGSGVKELRYWVGSGAPVVAPGAAASFQILQQGTHAVHLRAIDNAGNASPLTTLVVRVDATAPVLSAVTASPSALAAPNHKMVDVALGYTAADDSGGATCSLGVASNEPVNGAGDGDAAPDWVVVDEHRVRLRAERSGGGAGRVYTVTVTCADAAGNSASRSATVTVPRGR
ncbi:MAG TPA: alpha-amylase family glycosyl hydrolase [Pyrinomonadaceae bacterium]|jgi:glycosidase